MEKRSHGMKFTRWQVPRRLIFAGTVHRSQGEVPKKSINYILRITLLCHKTSAILFKKIQHEKVGLEDILAIWSLPSISETLTFWISLCKGSYIIQDPAM
jgi:hypothetical protein